MDTEQCFTSVVLGAGLNRLVERSMRLLACYSERQTALSQTLSAQTTVLLLQKETRLVLNAGAFWMFQGACVSGCYSFGGGVRVSNETPGVIGCSGSHDGVLRWGPGGRWVGVGVGAGSALWVWANEELLDV